MKILDNEIENLLAQGIPSTQIKSSKNTILEIVSNDKLYIRKFIFSLLSNNPEKTYLPFKFYQEKVNGDTLYTYVEFKGTHIGVKQIVARMADEIKVGVKSVFHANKMLEIRVSGLDEKKKLIQDQIHSFLLKLPTFLDVDIYTVMQQFFFGLSDQYYNVRHTYDITITIIFLSLMRKRITKLKEQNSRQRHVSIKVTKRELNNLFSSQESLCIVAGLNSLRKNELFKKEHLIKAIKSILPGAKPVQGSDFLYHDKENSMHLLIIDIVSSKPFTPKNISHLKKWLPRAIKGKVEQLQPTLFMPRNEEEIFKNIVTLGQQLRFANDLPQVIINFENQSEKHLIFNVILVRILHPSAPPLEDILLASCMRPKIDRVRNIGMLRRKYPKEAVVFKVDLNSRNFLREDLSIDLYYARQKIIEKLEKVFGPLRDYNGGMISKHNELLASLKKELPSSQKKYSSLLEEFFHSLFPIEKRIFISPSIIFEFFRVFIDLINEKKGSLEKKIQGYTLYVLEPRFSHKMKHVTHKNLWLNINHDDKKILGAIVVDKK